MKVEIIDDVHAVGSEDAFLLCLWRGETTREAVAALKGQYEAVDEGLAKLNDDITRLEEKLADAKNRQKALIMRHHTASQRLNVRKQIHENKIDDALVRFEQFERKMEGMEGRIEAYDLGMRKDLRREFDDLESEERIEQELQQLKKKMSGGGE